MKEATADWLFLTFLTILAKVDAYDTK